MRKYSTVVIGGGAAGICAAISKGRQGESVIICEKMPQLGKKILASGDGRCNLLNDDLSEVYYNPAARDLVRSIFNRFGKREILDFFKGLGLEVYSKEGPDISHHKSGRFGLESPGNGTQKVVRTGRI